MIPPFLASADSGNDPGALIGLLVLLGLWVAFSLIWGAICGYVAREKDRNQGWWTALGFFGWFFAYLAIAAVPDLSEYEPSDPSPERGVSVPIARLGSRPMNEQPSNRRILTTT